MSLPTLSTLNTTQDTNKQLSIIRSYLVQLKDELEAELSNVTYDMLSASLQKRIDAIDDDIANNSAQNDIVAQMVTTQYAKVGSLLAEYVRADELAADVATLGYATVGSLNAVSGRVTTIETSYITAKTVESNYATIDSLNSYMLTSTYVSAGLIKASVISTDIARATTVTAVNARVDSLVTATTNATQGSITTGTVNVGTLKLYAPNSQGVMGYKSLTGVQTVTISGKSYRLIGYQL